MSDATSNGASAVCRWSKRLAGLTWYCWVVVAILAMFSSLSFAASIPGNVTVDFNSAGFAESADHGSPVFTQGDFKLTYSAANWFQDTNDGAGGSAALFAGAASGVETITIETTSGNEFDFVSFYINAFNGGFASVEGFRDGVSVGTQTTGAGFGQTNGTFTVSLNNNPFNNVDKVIITSNGSGYFDIFDNFVFNTVPDATPPTVTSVSVPANATYITGNTLTFTVNTSENVIVNTGGGTPRIALTIGATTKYASYASGSGSSELVFSYTVESGLSDTDGITVGALSDNGGTLRDAANNNMTLTLNSVGSTANVLVDSIAPAVSSVTASTANGLYKTGDVISIQVNFSENVIVNTGGGTPQLTLETGTVDRAVNYTSGSGSSSLTFSYTIASGDLSVDLDYVATNALAANGGTIRDAAGNDATLTLATPGAANSLGNNKALQVDGVVPAVNSTAPAGSPGAAAASVDFTVMFSEAVSNISIDDFALGTTGTASGSITGVSASSGSSVTVTVSGITGNGSIKLNLNGATDISDAAGNMGPAAYTAGTAHTVLIPTAPDAPTIGAVTPADGQVSVAFTAPVNDGGSAVTGYTVTSNPLGLTGTGASSPIVVSGLTNGTAYTFTVTATNAVGTSAASAASAAATPKADQSITFAQPAAQNFGTTPTLSATASSGLVVSFTSSTTGVCTITSAGALTFVTAGSCTINADQEGDSAWNAALQISRTFTVNAVVPAAPVIGTATAGNTEASVTFTAPANTGGAAISGYTVTANPGGLTGTGASSPITVTGLSNGLAYTFTVTATNSAGTGSASAASNAVTPAAPQTITFADPGVQTFGTSPTLTATASSGLTVSFSSGTTGVCTVSGVTLTFISAGTCTIHANQAGDANYLAAPQVSRSFTVDPAVPGAPTGAFATAGDTQASVAFVAPVNTGGTAITGYTVTVSPAHVAPVNGAASPIVVNGLTNGQAYTFTVTADNAAGTGPASAASNVITPATVQTITFVNPGPQTFGSSPTLVASSDSTLPVSFSSTTPAVCTITSVGVLTTVSAGTCTINADQAGNASFLAASQVSRNFSITAVAPGAPVIGSASVSGSGASVSFSAPANTGGSAITGYTVTSNPGGLTATGASSPLTVSGLSSGVSYTFTVTATNAAGTSTASAASNAVTLQQSQTISFVSPGDQQFGNSVTLSATASSGLAVSFSSTSPAVCTVAGNSVSLLTTGTCSITATQAGNSSFEAAASVSVSFQVTAALPGAPGIGDAVRDGDAVVVSFSPPANTGGSAISSYSVESVPAGVSGSGSSSPVRVSGLVAGVSYRFLVRANNAAGAGPASSLSNEVVANRAPVASAASATVAEDGSVLLTLSGTDPDNDPLQSAPVTQPQHGTLTQLGNDWLYAPAKDYHGDDRFSFVVKDSTLTSAPAQISLTVTPVNDNPVAQNDTYELPRASNDSYSLDVLGNDSDVDGDTLQLVSVNSSVGTASVSGSSISLTAAAGYAGPVNLRYSISDGKGGSASATVSLLITGAGTDLPVITVPADITVNATALFTRVPLGTATAVDSAGRRLRVALINGSLFFAPGEHQVFWQATDAQGRTATKPQMVRVNPLISLSKDQIVSEGSEVTVQVLLNGPSPTYPVVVSYSVGGSANASDHTLQSGVVSIDSGLSATLSFRVLEDAVSEGAESIDISLSSGNLGSNNRSRITISNNNLAPEVSLSTSQQGQSRLTVSRSEGPVSVTATVKDANALDQLTGNWSAGRLSGADISGTSLTFDPAAQEPGLYQISYTATDNGEPPLSTTATAYVLITPALPALTKLDSDGDLIPDDEEGFADSDGDGIADYLDAISECNVVPQQSVQQVEFLSEGEPGICLRRGETAVGSESGGVQVLPDEVPSDPAASNVGGIFDFIAYGLKEQGQSYSLALPQRLPVPAAAVYRKYNDVTGWTDFVTDDRNYISSAAGERGFCPPPGDASWGRGLTEGHWCVQVTVQDGGPNDADGLANGTIVDPGGVAVLQTTNKAPVAKADLVTTLVQQSVLVNVLSNDSDEDGDVLKVVQASATLGSVTIEADSQLRYTPALDFIGEDQVTYAISDGKGGTASSTLTVTVRANQPPVVVNDSAATDDRTTITVNVLANDTDADGDSLRLLSASALQGSVTVEADQRLKYTPKAGFNGIDVVTYRVSDGNGATASGQLSVTVTAYQQVVVENKSSGGATGYSLAALLLVLLGRRWRLLWSVPLLFVLPRVMAASQSADWWLSVGVGQARAAVNSADIAARLPASPAVQRVSGLTRDDTSWQLKARYPLWSRLWLEAGYLDLGKAEVQLQTDSLNPALYHQAVRAVTPVLGDGYFAGAAVSLWQHQDWQLLLPAGVYRWQLDISSQFNGNQLRTELDGTAWYYGLELHWQLSAPWGLGLSWQRLAPEPNRIDNVQLQLSYRF